RARRTAVRGTWCRRHARVHRLLRGPGEDEVAGDEELYHHAGADGGEIRKVVVAPPGIQRREQRDFDRAEHEDGREELRGLLPQRALSAPEYVVPAAEEIQDRTGQDRAGEGDFGMKAQGEEGERQQVA